MKCQYCGNEMAPGALFCSQCGKKAEVQKEKICPACGHKGKKEDLFCAMCGTRLTEAAPEPQKKICPKCGQEGKPGMLFCEYCGSRLAEDNPPFPNPVQDSFGYTESNLFGRTGEIPLPKPLPEPNLSPQPAPVPQPEGRLLMELGMMSYYKGEPTIGIAKATGKLLIFDDRVEYYKKWGSSAGALFGVAGMLVAASQAKKNGDCDTYWYKDVQSVKEGRYGGIYHTVVLVMRDGQRHSFAGTLSSAKIQEAVAQISRSLG